MIPDIHSHTKMMLEHRQQLEWEAEQERMLARLPQHRSSLVRHMIGSFRHMLRSVRYKNETA